MNLSIFLIICVIFSPAYTLNGFDSEFNNGLQNFLKYDKVKPLQLTQLNSNQIGKPEKLFE
jgi:hypothetical protein